jgi:predicted TIM-barrel fold metal-dependent hydrolase
MPYAQGRTFYDADSHLMETSDWLATYADPDVRERLLPLSLGQAGPLADEAVATADRRRTDPDLDPDADAELMARKGWSALGAFDPIERSRALDLLGFERQLVFTTFAPTQFLDGDPDLLYGGTTAHNRAVADFCAHDRRLIGVGFVPLDVPERAAAAVDEAIGIGCGAVLVPSVPPQTQSPTHPDMDPVWARLQEANVPFMLHVGGGGRLVPLSFHANGRPMPTDFLGGGENIRSKDYMGMYHPPEIFLAAMVLDGVFDRFPGLRAGCIEQGGMWVVPLLRRLDLAQFTFAKTEPLLSELSLKPSEYLRRQVKFTPFPTEPVGWMIEQAGPELFCFSSDYPHPEGGRDPLRRFETSLEGIDEDAKERFYAGNFAEMMGMTVAA